VGYDFDRVTPRLNVVTWLTVWSPKGPEIVSNIIVVYAHDPLPARPNVRTWLTVWSLDDPGNVYTMVASSVLFGELGVLTGLAGSWAISCNELKPGCGG
jgi:hypothetical protein